VSAARDRNDGLLAQTEIAIETTTSDRRPPMELAIVGGMPDCELVHLPV